MVSTPIGPSAVPETCTSITAPTQQYQNLGNILGNPPYTQTHTFPILYNNSFITSTPMEVQPVSLYTEYIDNPYNLALKETKTAAATVMTPESNTASTVTTPESNIAADTNALWAQYLQQKQILQCQNSLDTNKNMQNKSNETVGHNADVFRSSNYFNNETNSIPPGSEILFGNGQQTTNIPMFSNANINSSGN